MTIQIGTWWVKRDPCAARRSERIHGGPARYLVVGLGGESPWAEVVLARYTGRIAAGRRVHTKAYRLVDEYAEEVSG